MTETQIKQAIATALQKFTAQPLAQAATKLFETLGYKSEKRLKLPANDRDTFLATFADDQTLHSRALSDQWKSIDFLFQLTDEEISDAGGQKLLFDSSKRYDNAIIESYLFLAIELTGSQYTRTELSGITREINKLFKMPALVLFRHGDTLTLAVINRRMHKREAEKDVLEKVTLIKDIRCADPHRAHLEILFDLSFDALLAKHPFDNFVRLHAAWKTTLDTSALNRRFYQQLANWYFWALGEVKFPKDAPKDTDGRDSLSVIRLVTRVIFCWFLKEKGLLPAELFDVVRAPKLLGDDLPAASTYYKAILQNLFFATLNQEMGKREFRKSGQNFMAHNLYRYRDLLADPDAALSLFASIPFMNGGLFECLDKVIDAQPKPQYRRIDGFSDRDDNELRFPNELFFGKEHSVDLSAAYNDKKFKSANVEGLIRILDRYKFTVAENTPIEEEIALDPELLGQVFENLLAAYNPETGATARKQTGSFYTPREIVNYMVDESLIACLTTKLTAACPLATDIEERLRNLFAYNEQPHPFSNAEADALVEAIDHLNILDPACGSGAYPMGILHKLVFVLGKLDPGNQRWKAWQLGKATEIPDPTVRERVLADIEQSFAANELDYGRKLYLIENCIYGVDIQAIAVQISKLRFFISLIVDQKVNQQAENVGIRPLPNLETKFVAANTLIRIEKPKQKMLRSDEIALKIDAKEAELGVVRECHFGARTPATKAKYRDQDTKLRAEIAELLTSDDWNAVTAKKLADWDPYNQNLSAGFFDPEWMFGLLKGFDVIIGNPPYLFITELPANAKRYYYDHFQTAEYRFDVYGLFIEIAITSLLSSKGILTFIIPHTLLSNDSYEKLRRFLLSNSLVMQVVDIGPDVFPGAKNETMVFLVSKQAPPSEGTLTRVVKTTAKIFPEPINQFQINQQDWKANPRASWLVGISRAEAAIVAKLEQAPLRLGQLCTINQGLRTGDNAKYLSDQKLSEKWMPAAGGKEVGRYKPLPPKLFVYYEPKLLDAPRRRELFVSPEKLVVQEIRNITLPRRIVATYDDKQFFCLQSTNVINLRASSQNKSIRFLLAVLNSSAANFFFRQRFPGNNHIPSNQLALIPIPHAEKKLHDEVVNFVGRIIDVKKKSTASDTLDLERQIDELVYRLYGLTVEEIRVVEEVAPLANGVIEIADESPPFA